MLRTMTMSFTLHDYFDLTDRYSPAVDTTVTKLSKGERDGVHILNEKLEIPRCAGHIERPRLIEKLDRSLSQFAVSLVSGRAGTGKTSIAAAYALFTLLHWWRKKHLPERRWWLWSTVALGPAGPARF